MFIYFWQREQERACARRRRGREREMENPKQTLYWQQRAEAGLEPTNHDIMTWAEDRCLTDWAIQVPLWFYFLMFIFESKRMRMHTHPSGGRGRERGGQRIQTGLCADNSEPNGAQTYEPWDHDLSQSRPLNWLSHPGSPVWCYF